MKRLLLLAMTALLLSVGMTWAGSSEDFDASYARGNYAKALKIIRPLAARGNADAQSNLGVMYEQGKGVRQDFVRAHMWLNLGAVSDEADAVKLRHRVTAPMTPQQIVQAQNMARDCRQHNFKGCELDSPQLLQ